MVVRKRSNAILSGLAGIIVGLCLAQSSPFQAFFKAAFEKPYLPETNPLIHREAYVLAYDGRIKGASWVYEELSSSSLEGTADRTNFDFMEDPLIPASLQATKEDFKGSGFDRGHLCPAADARASLKSMKETFYLSNISPQNSQLNRKYWLKLERYARDLTKFYDKIYAITGPLFLAKNGKDGKRYVQYDVIGPNEVAVPTHYFKVIRAINGNKTELEAFIIPNQPIQQDISLQDFRVPIEKIEQAAGVIFNKR